jgi:signal peptidase I
MGYSLPEITVPEGELLVLGDNRNASLDSHLWGTLPRDELIGSAVLRYWPLARFGPIGTAGATGGAIRFSATGGALESPEQLD